MWLQLLGGIGLFLLGMILLSDGLKAVAGDSLRRLLQDFARTPLRALFTGTWITLLLQSSSATTLATIGFVSSGLLTFPQAVGVVFGANIGTTSTGWMVALLGLKFSITKLAMGMIGVGALLKLLSRGRTAHVGMALAGFGLIFVGIDALQVGMGGLADRISPEDLPDATLVGRLLLVLIGVVMTVIMQSSSASMATTLMAMHSGALTLDQAAPLVIGQSIGTSVTSAVGAIGTSLAAKRTALAHVVFNIGTAVVGFLILPAFVHLVRVIAEDFFSGNHEVALAAFQTLYKILGVLIFLPVIGKFCAAIERIIPERGPKWTQNLGRVVGADPVAAVEAGRAALGSIAHDLFGIAARRLTVGSNGADGEILQAMEGALRDIGQFIDHIPAQHDDAVLQRRAVSVLHAYDHLCRLHEALLEEGQLQALKVDEASSVDAESLHSMLLRANSLIAEGKAGEVPEVLASSSQQLAHSRRSRRREVLHNISENSIGVEAGLRLLDAIRWVDRIGYHAWRSMVHLLTPETAGGELHGAEFPEVIPPAR